MNSAIKAKFEKLETRRGEMVGLVRALPSEVQTKRPAPKEFCPIEVIQHMALAEGFDRDALNKNPPIHLSGKPARPSFFFSRALSGMRAGRRTPTFRAMTPKSIQTLGEAEAAWEAVRRDIEGYLRGVVDPEGAFVKLPFFGTLSALDLLELLDAHTEYHTIRFPKG